MSDEKWSAGDEAVKLKSLEVGQKNEKKKKRKLSWQETPKAYGSAKVLPKEEAIKLECTFENAPKKDPLAHASISDGELAQSKQKRRARGRVLASERGHPSSASFRSSQRRVKSLVRFESPPKTREIPTDPEPLPPPITTEDHKSMILFQLNEYTLRDIRQIHANMETEPTKPATSKDSFFRGLSRQQKLILSCLCLVDFTSFCSISIMAPFFPKEAKVKGMSETTCGFVFSFYAFVIFISSPFFGKILPQIGGKFLFLSGLFVTSNCNLLFGVLEYVREDFTFSVFCFLVQGMKALGASAYWTASYVFVANIFPSNISAVMGVIETFVGLGLSIGPAIGGFLYRVGGFGLPFYVLGCVLLLTLPVALWILPPIEGSSVKKNSDSLLGILTEPSVLIIGIVVVITSSVWSFLDPTLEPHLRQFDLTADHIGLIFLLFSALYGISSPLWGLLSDKTNNHWLMMTSGLLVSTVSLLLLGPAPFIPFLKGDLRLVLVSLAILGSAVSLSLLPTYQGLLTSVSVARGETENDLSTYSIVAGTWSSLYALGEVIGPLVGGILAENYGFPTCCTVVAAATFTLAIGSFIYFIIQDCLTDRGKNYRYKFEESDGYDSDCSDNSGNASRPLLQPVYQNRFYTKENSL